MWCLTFCFAKLSINSFFLSSFSFSNCLSRSWDLINLSLACSSRRWQSLFSFLLLALNCFLYSFSSAVFALSLLQRSSSHWILSLCCFCFLSSSALFLQWWSHYQGQLVHSTTWWSVSPVSSDLAERSAPGPGRCRSWTGPSSPGCCGRDWPRWGPCCGARGTWGRAGSCCEDRGRREREININSMVGFDVL